MSSACDEIISAIISSFMASFGLRHFLPPGNVMGRSCGCKPRKAFAFFCFICRSSVTFCFNSADRSVLASFGSCYSRAVLKCVSRRRRWRIVGGVVGKKKYMQYYNLTNEDDSQAGGKNARKINRISFFCHLKAVVKVYENVCICEMKRVERGK